MNQPNMATNNEKSNFVSTPMTMSEQDIATPILRQTLLRSSAEEKKKSKQIITSNILFTMDVRRSILAANPGKSFGDISRLLSKEWHKLPLLRKIDYMEQARRQNEVAEKQAGMQLMGEGTPQSPAETSDCSNFLETEIIIKEEPIDIGEDPTPSTLDHEFILPCTDQSYEFCSPPIIKEVFAVVKTEPIEESQQMTSNCTMTKPKKQQTSETAHGAKQMSINCWTTKPSPRKTPEKDNVRELTENRPTDEDTNGIKNSVFVSKKNPKQIVTGYNLFTKDVRGSIIAANPGRSIGFINYLLGTEWRKLPLLRKIDFRERAKRQNKEAEKQTETQFLGEGTPQSPAETSDCFDSNFLETEIVIKEEPIDISEVPTPSTLDHEFILPCTDSYQFCSTPTIKEVFAVVKTEPIEESQQIV